MIDFIFCDHAFRKKGRHIAMHSHNCHELVLYGSSAHGEISIDDKSYSFGAYSIAVIPQGQAHSEYHYFDANVYIVRFTSPQPVSGRVYADMAHTKRIFSDILQEVNNKHYGYKKMLHLLIEEILTYVERKNNTEYSEVVDLGYAKRYIEENYMRNLTINELAKLTNYSASRLRHVFAERFGVSPKRYMIMLRLSKAAEMLRTTQFSCTEIAQVCGFSNSTQMANMFRKYKGVTPSECRKE